MTKHRVEALIDLGNIKHNYEYVKSLAGQECRVMAVVKADAYGHGAARVCAELEKAGADFFAVACIEEALALRKSGIKTDILILGITCEDYADQLAEHNLIQTVGSLDYAKRLSDRGGARVHIKIDTGMSRLGMYCHSEEDIQPVIGEISEICGMKNLKTEGIFTHFAEADNPSSSFTEKQFALFSKLLEEADKAGLNPGLRHCCNSSAILNFPHMKLDMVRAGIILYGLTTAPHKDSKRLLPAMTLKSRVASLSALKKGDYVSYGCTYRAERDMQTAVISIGYADGFSRSLSEKVYVKINGKKARIVGKICMDLCVADVSGIDCEAGDEVIVFENAEDINAIADILGTINYEIICLLKQRVRNTYKESSDK